MIKKVILCGVMMIFMLDYSAGLAGASDEAAAQTVTIDKVALDTGWTLIAAALVMFMQAGFAMLTAGFSRSKNACNMLMKNLMDFCFGTISYWAVGFGLMFGAGNLLFGQSGFFLIDAGDTFASLN